MHPAPRFSLSTYSPVLAVEPTHSQLMAISSCGSMPKSLILGMSLTLSMYAALHPVPKIQAIFVAGLT